MLLFATDLPSWSMENLNASEGKSDFELQDFCRFRVGVTTELATVWYAAWDEPFRRHPFSLYFSNCIF